jgi:sugar lactone lactonase YvrE
MFVQGLAAAEGSRGSAWQVLGPARQGPVFYRPAGVAADGAGNVYLSDSGNFRIAKVSPTGKVVASWGGKGSGAGSFGSTRSCAGCDVLGPGSAAAGKAGVVYVDDPGNKRIEAFSSNGRFVSAWHVELAEPLSLAVDRQGSVLVAEHGSRITKLSVRGEVQARWNIEEADRPGVTLVSVAADSNGDIYAAGWWPDSSHPGFQQHWFIQKLSSAGERLDSWQDVGGTLAVGGGRVYVGRGPTLTVLDRSGAVVARWTNPRFTSIVGIAATDRAVYVSEDESNRLVKVSLRGNTLRQWGVGGSGNGRFVLPWEVALDSVGNVYVGDLRARGVTLQRLSPTGMPLAGWAANAEHGLGVDARGNVYVVAYPGRSVLREYAPTGRLTGEWPLEHPASRVTADGRGDVYVFGDCSGLCIDKLRRGRLLSSWKLPGDSRTLADGPIAVDAQGDVYAAELLPDLRNGIQRISLGDAGKVAVSRIGSRSWARLAGIAIDRRSNLYIADSAAGRIEKLSRGGSLLAGWGESGSRAGRFHQPAGVAVDVRGNVFVADSGNSRVQKLSTGG